MQTLDGDRELARTLQKRVTFYRAARVCLPSSRNLPPPPPGLFSVSLENQRATVPPQSPDPIKSDYTFRRGPRARIRTGTVWRARARRPLSIRNDFRGWFYPPTFLISATSGPPGVSTETPRATLRRFELRGEPKVREPKTPGSLVREKRSRSGQGGRRRGRGEQEGRG